MISHFWSVNYVLGTRDFDAQMSGIKTLKANDILRPVYKNCFPKYWVVASILDFLVHKK
jgi:hypothetical protein